MGTGKFRRLDNIIATDKSNDLTAQHAAFAASADKSVGWRRFSGAIDNINDRLEQYADGRKQITYVDCHEIFLTDNSRVSCLPAVLHLEAQEADQLVRPAFSFAPGFTVL